MDIALVRLLQLVSPSLPVGAFAYSQGLESAVSQQLVIDQKSTEQWIKGLLEYALKQLDLPILNHLMTAYQSQDLKKVLQLNKTILAFRATSEIRNESINLGRALRRLLLDLDIANADSLPKEGIDWSTAFACAAISCDISNDKAMLGYAWSWCENQVAAAIKLVPLGQTQGQLILMTIGNRLPNVIKQASKIELDDVGATAPHLAILSSQHETQYSRLFRS